jgi:hypothetical protein
MIVLAQVQPKKSDSSVKHLFNESCFDVDSVSLNVNSYNREDFNKNEYYSLSSISSFQTKLMESLALKYLHTVTYNSNNSSIHRTLLTDGVEFILAKE